MVNRVQRKNKCCIRGERQGSEHTTGLGFVNRGIRISLAVVLVNAVPPRFLFRRFGEVHFSPGATALIAAHTKAAGPAPGRRCLLVHARVVGVDMK